MYAYFDKENSWYETTTPIIDNNNKLVKHIYFLLSHSYADKVYDGDEYKMPLRTIGLYDERNGVKYMNYVEREINKREQIDNYVRNLEKLKEEFKNKVIEEVKQKMKNVFGNDCLALKAEIRSAKYESRIDKTYVKSQFITNHQLNLVNTVDDFNLSNFVEFSLIDLAKYLSTNSIDDFIDFFFNEKFDDVKYWLYKELEKCLFIKELSKNEKIIKQKELFKTIEEKNISSCWVVFKKGDKEIKTKISVPNIEQMLYKNGLYSGYTTNEKEIRELFGNVYLTMQDVDSVVYRRNKIYSK